MHQLRAVMRDRLKADAGLLFVALIWGATFPVVKVALRAVPPFTFNTLRFSLSCILFALIFKDLKLRDTLTAGIKIGFVVFAGYALQTVGLVYTTATDAGYITSLYVVLTPVVAWLLYRSPVSPRDVFCTMLALAGMALLSNASFKANLLLLGCAFAFATEIAMISHHSKISCPNALAFWQILAVALFSLPFSVWEVSNFSVRFSKYVLFALVITAVLATVVARYMQNNLQKMTKATDAAILFSMEGVFSHMFSAAFLGETLMPIQYIGAFAIVLAVLLVSVRG